VTVLLGTSGGTAQVFLLAENAPRGRGKLDRVVWGGRRVTNYMSEKDEGVFKTLGGCAGIHQKPKKDGMLQCGGNR